MFHAEGGEPTPKLKFPHSSFGDFWHICVLFSKSIISSSYNHLKNHDSARNTDEQGLVHTDTLPDRKHNTESLTVNSQEQEGKQ